jgi:hypothetical protein
MMIDLRKGINTHTIYTSLLLQTILHNLKDDFHPLKWMSEYHRTTVTYLIAMLFFYHAIGILIVVVSTPLIEILIEGYDVDQQTEWYKDNYTLVLMILAGPWEETFFFGIPFYVTGNPILVLTGGILWTIIHLPNTEIVSIDSLAYPQFFGQIPIMFFSLRTWISGKGWFAVVSHSAWNFAVFTIGCTGGELSCNVYSEGGGLEIVFAFIASILVAITYLLYRRRVTKLIYKIIIMTPVMILMFIISIVPLAPLFIS